MAKTDKSPGIISVVFFLLRPSVFRRVALPKVILLLLLSSLVFLLLFTSFSQRTALLFSWQTKLLRQKSSAISKAEVRFGVSGNLPSENGYPRAFPATPVSSRPQKCVLPPLQLDDPLMMSFVRKQPPITCPFPTPEWVHVHNGTLVFSQEAVAKVGKFTCDVSPLVRSKGNDNKVSWGTQIVNFSSGSQLTSDFNKVECRTLVRPVTPAPPPTTPVPPAPPGPPGAARPRPRVGPKRPPPPYYDYTDILMGVSPLNQAVWKRLKETAPPANGLSGLSVLMMGFDSMSRMSWLRRMKSTQEYLVNRLGGIELEGYNIMGDGTPAALFPILTGTG